MSQQQQQEAASSSSSSTTGKKYEKLGVTALAFFVFSSAVGSPFDTENLISNAGPLYALLLLFLVPIFCIVPLIFMIEELCSWSPSRHGNIKFVHLAFGSTVGFVNSFFTISYNLCALPVYAVYGINYLIRAFGKETFESISNDFATLYFMRAVFVIIFGIPSFFEIKEMGIVTGILTVLIVAPFVVGFFAGVGNIDTSSWSATKSDLDFATAFSLTNFLYLGFLANASISGEVKQRALFKGQLIGLVLAVLVYFFPLVVTLQLNTNYKEWTNGYLVDLFEMILKSLGPCVSVAGFLSGAAQFLTALVCYTRSIWAVANLGWFPKIFLKTNRYNSPYVGAILHMLVCFILILFDFEFLVNLQNVLFTTILILFAVSFIVLRYKEPIQSRLSPRFVVRNLLNNSAAAEAIQEEEEKLERQQEQEAVSRELNAVQNSTSNSKISNDNKNDNTNSNNSNNDQQKEEQEKSGASGEIQVNASSATTRSAPPAAVLDDGFEDDDEEDLGVFVVPGGNCFAAFLMPLPLIMVMLVGLVLCLSSDSKLLAAYFCCLLLASYLCHFLNYHGKSDEEIAQEEAASPLATSPRNKKSFAEKHRRHRQKKQSAAGGLVLGEGGGVGSPCSSTYSSSPSSSSSPI